MLQPVGVKNCGRRAWRPITLTAASVAVFAFILPPDRAIAQDAGSWFGFGAPSQRRPVKVRRHALSAKQARESDDEAGRPQKRKSDDAAGTGSKNKAANGSAGPLFAVLSLSDQHISIYNSSGLVTRGKVSTGMPGHRTPSGIFSIVGRERWHRSNIYSGAPMPFMQRITWSGIALHLGVVPGYPASHGCIRLPAGFAEKLWGMTKIGERVVVAPHEITPTEIAHPLLPVPKMQPGPDVVADNTPVNAARMSVDPTPHGALTEVAAAKSDALPVAAASTSPKMLNPVEYAQVLKTRAEKDAAAAATAIKENSHLASVIADEARKAAAQLRAAEAARAQAEERLAAKAKALDASKTPEAREAAAAAKATADAQLLDAAKKLEEARQVESAKSREALDAERVLKEARTALVSAQATAREAARRVSPVSILVSKKDKRIYIRQGLAPVLDAPATIRDPEIPLGTHVYIASSSQNEGQSLGWSVVSLPSSAPGGEARSSRREREASRDQRAARSEPPSVPQNATQALERIEIPKDVSARISELLWTGSSLIISDQPLSNETSDIGTDIVVTTR